MDESLTDPEQYSLLPDAIDTAADLRSQRAVALRALQVLEHALTAPAPRRHRTWLHRVTIALDGLRAALDDQLHSHQDSVDLLAELAMSEPDDARPVERLRQDLLDLTIAVASLREQIEPDPVINIDPDDIRNQLGRIANRFRQHQAVEADLVYQATGIELDEPLSWN